MIFFKSNLSTTAFPCIHLWEFYCKIFVAWHLYKWPLPSLTHCQTDPVSWLTRSLKLPTECYVIGISIFLLILQIKNNRKSRSTTRNTVYFQQAKIYVREVFLSEFRSENRGWCQRVFRPSGKQVMKKTCWWLLIHAAAFVTGVTWDVRECLSALETSLAEFYNNKR